MGRLFWIVRWPNVITGSLYERDGGEAGGGQRGCAGRCKECAPQELQEEPALLTPGFGFYSNTNGAVGGI